MLEEGIEKTESAVKAAGNISADQKAELLGLLARLNAALGKVEHREDAESIARFAQASVYEATREKKKPNVLEVQSADKRKAFHHLALLGVFLSASALLVRFVCSLLTSRSGHGGRFHPAAGPRMNC